MSAITNPQAVKFSDEYCRRFADLCGQQYAAAQQVLAFWAGKNLSALFPADASPVNDSAVTGPDGRTPITGADVNAMVGFAAAIVADYTANGNAKLLQVTKVAVNPAITL